MSPLATKPGCRPIRAGRRCYGPYELDSYRTWWVFPAATTEEAAAAWSSAAGSGIPGHPFHEPVRFRRSRTRLLMTQRGGWDI